MTARWRIVAEGLQFPEGPVALEEGAMAVTEIRGGCVSRITASGERQLIANTGGGPNGLAAGPHGTLIVCNNGGSEYVQGRALPIGPARDWRGGVIQRVDPDGAVRTLYTHSADRRLSSPNDLVFDAEGGFWFSDFGKKHASGRDHGAIGYALPDGSRIEDAVFPLLSPNGVALSPNERVLYVADTETARIYAFDIEAPGRLRRAADGATAGPTLICALPQLAAFDSMAIDAEGVLYVATLMAGCVTVVDPVRRAIVRQLAVPDALPTNVCFAGPGRRQLFVTLAETGRLAVLDVDTPGHKLNFERNP